MGTLNRQGMEELFNKHAAYIGGRNVIPARIVIKLFGFGVMEHVASVCELGDFSGYAVDGLTVHYLTFQGFGAAVSYHNCKVLLEDCKEEII